MTTVVVGAGIIGTSLAYELQKRGRQVVLLDKGEVGRGASYGNMASIAVTEFMPASRPSVWRQIPGWMLDPEGPVRIRPSYMPRLVPWFARFVAASRPSKLRALEAQGAALCLRVYDDLLPLLHETGLTGELTEEGCLSLYSDEAEFRADREHIEILERFGFPHQRLTGAEARELEPELSDSIGIAVLFPQNRSLRDPYRLVVALADRFAALGGRIERGEVAGFDRSDRVTAVRLADGRTIPAAEVAICAGAHSARLSKLLGEPMPLETERGYHTQIMAPGIAMRHSIIWPARAFMATPTAGGIRVGGTVEMAGLDAAPDYRRSKITVKRAREALPNLACEDFTEWMGHRPAFPDTVPVMSASARVPGVFYATGHGHLGVTYAATNARLMGDLITGAPPPIDMRPYRIDRF
ncbi:FAD-binding oxidoreductase (plasmid) [Paracoccus versutus]|uniref:Glycine/D-amino acid oxidase-like deaminating enzyme n=1 Tax=Paracoccus versutus TaxID=34007 RepID=A0AAQ0KMW7_PARVE|nr:FAD-binding oxidoreductase [Paracoccus versutus]KGJ08339.1 amino acid dehydrogenase [Paracoccus versutus]REG54387.1 glycine/D-amino acid oxidase-like deaminating enzyme [Paracoccus versutus]WEJ80232.1 FAD-binding oxidoreductase [Paracoccus versutus]